MKTSNSKLFRKIAINRASNRLSARQQNTNASTKPIENWWKAVTIKG